jgi:hypothetical protein
VGLTVRQRGEDLPVSLNLPLFNLFGGHDGCWGVEGGVTRGVPLEGSQTPAVYGAESD